MLARILSTMTAAGRPLCLAELREALGIDESALEGMLETLTARGRLRTIRFDDVGCGGCPIRSGCFLMANGVSATYALAGETQGGNAAVEDPRASPGREAALLA